MMVRVYVLMVRVCVLMAFRYLSVCGNIRMNRSRIVNTRPNEKIDGIIIIYTCEDKYQVDIKKQ